MMQFLMGMMGVSDKRKMVVILAALLVGLAMGCCVAFGDEAKEKKDPTPEGTWKVKSTKVNGAEKDDKFGPFAKSAVWNFRSDGSTSLGGEESWKWRYDARDREMIWTARTWLGESKRAMSVAFKGGEMRIKFSHLLQNFEIVLERDD